MFEYEYFDGSDFTIFDIIEIDNVKNTITVAATYLGKISVLTHELYNDKNGSYFEYGPLFNKIHINKFIFKED